MRILLLFALMSGLTSSVRAEPVGTLSISLEWRLIGNVAENRFRSQLKLTNGSSVPLAGGWALYFNSAARLFPDSVSPAVTLTHINGDFYVLRPSDGASSLPPGESQSIEYEGGPWAINVSDVPSGFYLVLNERSGRPSTPIDVPLKVGPFPAEESLRRGAEDVVPVTSAESRYLANAALNLLPPESLTKVVPTPIQVKRLSGEVTLGRDAIIFFNDPLLANEARYLADAMEPLLEARIPTHLEGSIDAPRPGSIRLRIKEAQPHTAKKRNNEEAYALTVTPEGGIEISGSSPSGVFYGVQTLRALLPIESYSKPPAELTIDAVRIVDAPRFPYRGLHLDVARNFQSKETVKKLLDLMAFYKLNRFHWHLTDDEGWRFEVKSLPELAEVGGRRGHTLDEADHLMPSHGSGPFPDAAISPGSGFYTQDQFVEILRYAHSRHITVIPELDFPGHARAAVKAMEARHRRLAASDPEAADEFLLREPRDTSKYESVQLWNDNVVDVGRESSYRFLAVVVDELIDLFRRAGAPLVSIHLGGDEVPRGVWEHSAACNKIKTNSASKIPRRGRLELYFLNRASEILAQRFIQPACWDDCLLLEVDEDAAAGDTRRAAGKPVPTAYVWNNVWGWGREDAAYRLANAGFDVVLSSATHLYFDLACEKDPLEPGYYWAGFVDARAPFEFAPLNVFKNAKCNAMGQPLSRESLAGGTRLTAEGTQHITGIQGQLWGENLRSEKSLEYMAFPRIIALAERAWAATPAWAEIDDREQRELQLERDWNQFANRLGQRELPRLDYLFGGIHYRLPPPGAVVRDGQVRANVEFPGMAIHYTIDGSTPTVDDPIYRAPIPVVEGMQFRSFDSRGRGSRSVIVSPSDRVR